MFIQNNLIMAVIAQVLAKSHDAMSIKKKKKKQYRLLLLVLIDLRILISLNGSEVNSLFYTIPMYCFLFVDTTVVYFD